MRVEQLERVSPSGSLSGLRDRVDKVEADSQSGPAFGEPKRIQEMIEDLYRRVGDLEEERVRGKERGRSGLRPEDLAQPKPQDRKWRWRKKEQAYL